MQNLGNYALNSFKIPPSFGQSNYASSPNFKNLEPLPNDTFVKSTKVKEPEIQRAKDGTIQNIIEFDPLTGNVVREKNFREDGKTLYVVFEFNPLTKKPTRDTYFQKDGKTLQSIREPITDDIDRTTDFAEDGKTIKKIIEYVRDPKTKEIKKGIEYKPDGKTIDVIIENDPKTMNIIETYLREDGRTKAIVEYDADTKNVIKETRFQSDGKTIDSIQEFDAKTGKEIKPA